MSSSPTMSLSDMMQQQALGGQEPPLYDQPTQQDQGQFGSGPGPSDDDVINAAGPEHGEAILNAYRDVQEAKANVQDAQLNYLGKTAEAIKAADYHPGVAAVLLQHVGGDPDFAGHVAQISAFVQQNPQALKPIVDNVADQAAASSNGGSGQQGESGAEQERGDDDQHTGGSHTTVGLTDRQKANQASTTDDDDDSKPPVDASGLVGVVPVASQSNAQSDAIGNIVRSMKPGALPVYPPLQQAAAQASDSDQAEAAYVRPANVEAERQAALQRGQATQPPVTDAQRNAGLVIRVGIRRLKAGPVGHHTYLEIPRLDQDGQPVYDSNGNVEYDSYGVLGQWDDQKQDGITDNQQVIKNDIHVKGKGLELRNEPIAGSDNNVLYEIAVTPDQLARLKAGAEHWSQWRETGDECPSCGKNYRRGDGPLGYQPGYNSNTWVYNMLIQNPAGRIEPPAEIIKKQRASRDKGINAFAPGWDVYDAGGGYYPQVQR